MRIGSKNTSKTKFLPYSLKQTGNIDLTDISVKITSKNHEPPIQFFVEEGKGGFANDIPIRFTLKATLDSRKFALDIQGGRPAELTALHTDWPISLHFQHKSVVFDVHGHAKKGEAGPVIKANFSLTGDHFNDLVSIFNIHGSNDQSFALAGTTVLSKDEIRGDFSRVQLGREDLTLSISLKDYLHNDFSCKTAY